MSASSWWATADFFYASGTTRSQTEVVDKSRGMLVKNSVYRSVAFENQNPNRQETVGPGRVFESGIWSWKQDTNRDDWERAIKETAAYSMTELRSLLSRQLRPPM